ncbi:membrane protein [Microbacterium mangrovi]|uniref:Membrane protein n=1 Tax=Microbacterium mangrovi TaxID=1348253 RepID=A0A0B1ZXR8_9MICO|nr:YhgE/Pip domain-containing protein [Microbacterium mangrovi]KHK96020.1 membrane protein [Microbacterium mangrovi]
MKIPAMVMAELRRLTATKMSRLAVAALMLVPLLYGGLYLWANQDPYGKLADVPVALVVDDEGADGTNYGDTVADQLIKGGAFDWMRMSEDGASRALHDGAVDFTVTIPANFSAALTSAAGSDPHQATISLETNDANNYLASTIGAQAVEKIRRSVAETVGETAANRLLTAISDIRSSLVKAADGAGQLADGTDQAQSGAAQLQSGAHSLAGGTRTLAGATHQVADGAASLASGAAELQGGSATLAQGSAKVAAGAKQVAAGNATIAGYADQAGSAMQTATDKLPQLRQDIITELRAQGLDDAQIDRVLGKLDPIASRISQGNTKVQSAVGKIDALSAGANQVSSGAAQVSSGASALHAGATKLASGASTLSAGAAKTAAGADSAAAGAAKLSSGTDSLATGLATLDKGAHTLATSLADGAQKLPKSDAALREAQAKTIADPIAIDSGKVATAKNYGAGLAPFFVALAAWIGIYALFNIIKPVSRRAMTALRKPVRITFAGWLTPALLGVLQMVALFGVLAVWLGFSFGHPWGTLGIMFAASLTFAAIILALNVWLGSTGQFLGLVFMVMQLVTAGGTFPWQTLPTPLAGLHHVLPMGYVTDALRQVMYGGNLDRVGTDLLVLGAWLVGALAITALGVARKTHHRTLRDLQPSLMA